MGRSPRSLQGCWSRWRRPHGPIATAITDAPAPAAVVLPVAVAAAAAVVPKAEAAPGPIAADTKAGAAKRERAVSPPEVLQRSFAVVPPLGMARAQSWPPTRPERGCQP